jgi:hypothetical protein
MSNKYYAHIFIVSTFLVVSLVFAQTKDTMKLEPLYGLQLVEQQFIIKVKSHGCTKVEDFIIDSVHSSDSQQTQLRIIRQQADHCRAMPHIIELALQFNTHADRSYYINNPLAFNQIRKVK